MTLKKQWVALLVVLCIVGALLGSTLAAQSEDSFDDEFEEFEEFKAAKPLKPDQTTATKSPPQQASHHKLNFDDEEFEAQKPSTKATQAAQTVETETLKAMEMTLPFEYNFLIEIGSIVFLVAFGVNYYFGRRTNEALASSFARAHRDLFGSEFTSVGTNGAILVKESQHTFRLNATGRVNCIGLQANLRLNRRQDLVATLYNMFWSPTRDVLDIQIAMNEDTLDSMIFALAKNREARALTKEFNDLSLYTKSYKVHDQPKTAATLEDEVWTILGESKDLFPLLLSTEARTVLNKHKDLVKLIHITDQYNEHKEYKKVLHAMFYLPTSDKMDDLSTLLKMTFHLIDFIAKAKVPASTKSSIDKARSKVQTEAQKEALEKKKEELEQRKLDKRRKAMEGMNADERAAYEEKERQRKLKKRSNGKVMMVR